MTPSTLPRMNRIASFIILPMMTLAIVVFARYADDGESSAAPPEHGLLVVANLRAELITFIDLSSGERRELALPGPPHEIAFAGGRLYVTLGRANALAEIDPASGAMVRLLSLEGEPHGIAEYGGNLIVTLDRANAAVVLDRSTLTELRRYPTGDTPHMVAVSPGAVLVTDGRGNQLRQLEPGDRLVATGIQPEGLAIVGGLAVTADTGSGTLTIADAPGLEDTRTVQVGAGPVRVLALDAARVLVSLQGAGEVAVVRVDDGRVERRIAVAGRPDGLCVSPGSAYFAVASNADGVVEVFSSGDWKPAVGFSLSPGLGACAWLPGR